MKMEPFNPADLDYFPPGELRNGPDARAPQPPKFRHIINPADWEGLPVPPREWIVPGCPPEPSAPSPPEPPLISVTPEIEALAAKVFTREELYYFAEEVHGRGGRISVVTLECINAIAAEIERSQHIVTPACHEISDAPPAQADAAA